MPGKKSVLFPMEIDKQAGCRLSQNDADQQHRGAAASPVRAANGWEESLPDTFRQTERKGSAKPTGDERSHPASEGDFTACRKIV